jgi:hypothetical protein
LRFV